MTIINRKDITDPKYLEVLETESHHNHAIFRDAHGTIRWAENPQVSKMVDQIGMNEIIMLLHSLGYDRNSELYRRIYRNIGYSLYGYWEVFYWEANNPEAGNYRPGAGKIAFREVDRENDVWAESVFLFDTDEDVKAFFVSDNPILIEQYADGKKLKDFEVHHSCKDPSLPVTAVTFRSKYSGKVTLQVMGGGYIVPPINQQ